MDLFVIGEHVDYLFDIFIAPTQQQPIKVAPPKLVTAELLTKVLTLATEWANSSSTNRLPTRSDRMQQFISNSCLRGIDDSTAVEICERIRSNPKLWSFWCKHT